MASSRVSFLATLMRPGDPNDRPYPGLLRREDLHQDGDAQQIEYFANHVSLSVTGVTEGC